MQLIINSWSRTATVVILSILLLCIAGCEEQNTGTIDSANNAPQVNAASISPDSVNVDALTPTNGVYTVASSGSVQASDPDGNLSSVLLRVIERNSTETLSEATLHDDGVAPDLSAGDGVFSGTLTFAISRPETGPYRVQFLASDDEGSQSNVLELTLITTRRNSAPELDAESLIAPDTVQRPTSGSTLIFMSIAAADSDGLADITEVYFRNLDSPSQTKFFLLDDGGIIGPGGITSGDLLAGDAVFSIIIQIPSTIATGLYRFAFQAADSFGDTSSTLIHNLIIE